ncbi:MAG: peptidylprolyl isomerase [Planctomycetota bacterium]
MSATPTPSVEGTQAPSQIELLWDRYRSLVYVICLAVVGALGANYAIGYFKQKETDKIWTNVASSVGIDATYTDQTKWRESLADRLASVELASLRTELAQAPEAAKPYLLLAIARKSILDKDWDGAEGALKDLETRYPNHSLVQATPHPVQSREPVKKTGDEPETPAAKPKKPEFKPAVAGSQVGMVREQIAAARAYAPPAQFAKVAIPADATKIKFELGTTGSFVIALMPHAAKHREAFLKLAEAEPPFWVGLAIDEIRRPTKSMAQAHELHLGIASTKEDDRTKWTDTDPSKNPLDYEANSLSHFAGAVSARNEADGKSCADRFWVAVDDAPKYDGDRVIFGYVVEGLDVLKKVCESTMATAAEEDQGRGKPSDTIRVTAVSVLK